MSPSKIKVYDECKLKYKLRYIDRVPDKYNDNSSKDAMHFGSYIHKIFELGVEAKSEEELWAIAKQERSKYEFGPDKEKLTGKCITNFFKFNSKLAETVSAEMVFNEPVTDDFTINGIIDRVIKGATGKYLVIDYKTSKRAATQRDLYRDPQMLMYAAAIHKKYNVPIGDITVSHYYPHMDKLVSICYPTSQVNAYIRGELKTKIWEIRKKKVTDFPPVTNRFCDWCGYKDICPSFNSTPGVLSKAIEEAKEERQKQKPKVPLGTKPKN